MCVYTNSAAWPHHRRRRSESQYAPLPRRTPERATSSRHTEGPSGRTVDVRAFQHPHCRLAGSLRPADGFPALRLLRSLRSTRQPSADDEPARRCPGWPAGRATTGGSHVHHEPIDEGDALLHSGRLATSTPQPFLVASSPAEHPGCGVARPVASLSGLLPTLPASPGSAVLNFS
jgi:hypothetical protein